MEEAPWRVAREPPPPFQSRDSVDGGGGGGGSSGISGGAIDDGSEDEGRGIQRCSGRGVDERRPPVPSVRTSLERCGGIRWAVNCALQNVPAETSGSLAMADDGLHCIGM